MRPPPAAPSRGRVITWTHNLYYAALLSLTLRNFMNTRDVEESFLYLLFILSSPFYLTKALYTLYCTVCCVLLHCCICPVCGDQCSISRYSSRWRTPARGSTRCTRARAPRPRTGASWRPRASTRPPSGSRDTASTSSPPPRPPRPRTVSTTL